MTKFIKSFLFFIFCLIFSIFVVIPELTRNESELLKNIETFESSTIVKVPMKFRADKDYLIIKTKEGNEYEVGRTYSKYFNQLNSESNIDKNIVLYTTKEGKRYPKKIVIEKNIIYDYGTGNFWHYLILIATPILFYFSITEYIKMRKIKKTSR